MTDAELRNAYGDREVDLPMTGGTGKMSEFKVRRVQDIIAHQKCLSAFDLRIIDAALSLVCRNAPKKTSSDPKAFLIEGDPMRDKFARRPV